MSLNEHIDEDNFRNGYQTFPALACSGVPWGMAHLAHWAIHNWGTVNMVWLNHCRKNFDYHSSTAHPFFQL